MSLDDIDLREMLLQAAEASNIAQQTGAPEDIKVAEDAKFACIEAEIFGR